LKKNFTTEGTEKNIHRDHRVKNISGSKIRRDKKYGITTIKFDNGGELSLFADPQEIIKSGLSPYPVSDIEMMNREIADQFKQTVSDHEKKERKELVRRWRRIRKSYEVPKLSKSTRLILGLNNAEREYLQQFERDVFGRRQSVEDLIYLYSHVVKNTELSLVRYKPLRGLYRVIDRKNWNFVCKMENIRESKIAYRMVGFAEYINQKN